MDDDDVLQATNHRAPLKPPQDGEGMLAAVKNAAGRSLSRVTSPSRAVTSMTPVAGMRLLVRAGGLFPLLLWWAFSVARGVLPVVMSYLVSR